MFAALVIPTRPNGEEYDTIPLAVSGEGGTFAWDAWQWVGPDGSGLKMVHMAIGKHM